MTGIENALLDVERDALAKERARLTAAEDLLALVNEELAAMQETVNHLSAFLTGGA
ncbi:hypothetical protein ACQP2T_13495 [Nonomuraea sp. CA-143628]|uniref:hypothetical protein n=1 Tax=Nonomuraea sp. CA-143628 TaxID=3239997 RepID=UPI003D8C302A